MNLDSTLDYFAALGSTEETVHYWSGQHPDGRRVQAYGTLEEMLPLLVQRNAEGFGIFSTVNLMTPRHDKGIARRKATDVAAVRAVFADWDDVNKPISLGMLPIKPSMVVQTSKRKYHIYWLVDDLPMDMYEQVQRGIAQHLGTDKAVIDLCREVRVPGFMHTKDLKRRTEVTLKLCNPDLRYSPLDVVAAFPFDMREAKVHDVVHVGPLPSLTHALVNNLYGPPRKEDGAYVVPCPWVGDHTTKSNPTSTIYYPPHQDNGGKGFFKCLHSHCAERYADAFDAYMEDKLRAAFK